MLTERKINQTLSLCSKYWTVVSEFHVQIAKDKAAIVTAEQKIKDVGKQIENLHFKSVKRHC